MSKRKIAYADDDTESVFFLFKLRAPSLAMGMILGILLSFTTSRFEELLVHNIRVAFFIPLIVYMADGVGTQTQSIYSRDLKSGHANFFTYLFKETMLGMLIGSFSGLASAIIVYVWYASITLSLAVGLAMCAAIMSAPLIALIVTEILQLEHKDPAVGAGPIATVIQDTVSILIYGAVASLIVLGG